MGGPFNSLTNNRCDEVRRIEEIPLRANDLIHQLNELTGQIVTAEDLGLSINRYRYFSDQVSSSVDEQVDVIKNALSELLPRLGAEPISLLCWRKEKPTPARSRLVFSKRTKEAWEISNGGNVWLATKPVMGDYRLPRDYEWQDGGLITLVGDQYHSVIHSEKAAPTLEDLALSGKLRPSPNFIKLLHDTNTSCIYFALDENKRIELIVLTNIRLS